LKYTCSIFKEPVLLFEFNFSSSLKMKSSVTGDKSWEIYLLENELLYEFQSGFRTSYSTDTCLIHLFDHIKSHTVKYTVMIMLDLQKAFDTVEHEILCNKLKVMGIRSTKWFLSYLTDRKQNVSANGMFFLMFQTNN
jgi:hypothetical protein